MGRPSAIPEGLDCQVFGFNDFTRLSPPICVLDESNCGCESSQQADYQGTISTTQSGTAYQVWDSQFPHGHTRTPSNYPGYGLESNYCRNPDGKPGAWSVMLMAILRMDMAMIVETLAFQTTTIAMIATTNALVVKMTRAVAMIAVTLQMAMMKAIRMMTATIMVIVVIAMPRMFDGSYASYDDDSGKSDCYRMMVTAAATMIRMATMAMIMKMLVTKVTSRVVSL